MTHRSVGTQNRTRVGIHLIGGRNSKHDIANVNVVRQQSVPYQCHITTPMPRKFVYYFCTLLLLYHCAFGVNPIPFWVFGDLYSISCTHSVDCVEARPRKKNVPAPPTALTFPSTAVINPVRCASVRASPAERGRLN